MKLTFTKTAVINLIAVFLCVPAHADRLFWSPGFFKSELCGGLLMSLTRNIKFKSTGEIDEATKTAYSGFREFRWSELKDRENDKWTFEEILTNSADATSHDLKAVALRIRALEKVHEEETLVPGTQNSYQAIGIQIRGEAYIKAHLTRQVLQANWFRAHRPQYMEFIKKQGGLLTPYYLWREKRLQTLNKLERDIPVLYSALDSPAAKEHAAQVWVYQGFNVDLPINFFSIHEVTDFERANIVYGTIHQEYQYKKLGPVQSATAEIDRLLRYERLPDGSFEPVLNIFVRFQAPRPKTPPKRKEDTKVQWQLEPELKPITIPVR